MTCTSPCTISGLDPGTEYQFTVIPNNNCGNHLMLGILSMDQCNSVLSLVAEYLVGMRNGPGVLFLGVMILFNV